MKNFTHNFSTLQRFLFVKKTKNGLKLKIRRNFNETTVALLQHDFFRQNQNKTCEKSDRIHKKFDERKISKIQPSNLNLLINVFKSNRLIELITKINGCITYPDKLLSQMSPPITVLKGLSGSKETAVSALSSKILSQEFKRTSFSNINKEFIHVFENKLGQQFRSMSSNNQQSDLSLLKNEILLANQDGKSPDSIILNLTINIPLADLNKSEKSNYLKYSEKMNEVIKLPVNNKKIDNSLLPMKTSISSVLPPQSENYNQENLQKGKSETFYSSDKKLLSDNNSVNEVACGKLSNRLVQKKSNVETTINESKAQIPHVKVKNINENVKMFTENLLLSPYKINQMLEEQRKENGESNNQMLCQTVLESYSKWLGKEHSKLNTADTEHVEKIKTEQSLDCSIEKEKEIYVTKSLNNLEEPEYNDLTTFKPLNNNEQLIKSTLNKNMTFEDDNNFKRLSENLISNHEYRGKFENTNGEVNNHPLKYYQQMTSEEMKLESKSENKAIKDDFYKPQVSRNGKFPDWRDQCSNINKPTDELYSLSNFKSKRHTYFNNTSTGRKKMHKKEKDLERDYRKLKESDRIKKKQLKHYQTYTKSSRENDWHNIPNIKKYQKEKKLSVLDYSNNKVENNYACNEKKKKVVFTENKNVTIDSPQNNKRLLNIYQNKIKKHNETDFKEQRTKVLQSETNYKNIRSELTDRMNKEHHNSIYPTKQMNEKKTKLSDLIVTEDEKFSLCNQNKSSEFSLRANSSQYQQGSKIKLSREQQIAIKTAEFCKILLELVKLFSICAMKDIERPNNQTEKKF